MRLRGPWIVRGLLLDTSVSSQSGTIPGGQAAAVGMSAYSFFPDVLCTSLFRIVDLRLRISIITPPNADTPRLLMVNQSAGAANYEAEWRHVNP